MTLAGPAAGAILIVIYTLMMAGGDGITKFIAGRYEAPQLFAISALIVLALSLAVEKWRKGEIRTAVTTSCRWAMALRSLLTVLASVAFFQAFRVLPMAEIFLFLAMVPVIAAVMSGPGLGETVRPAAWTALLIGVAGMLCLFPGGVSSITAGHLWAAIAVLSGTASLVSARYISRREKNSLAQVFFPNAALFVAMACFLPLVWVPMQASDLGWILLYSFLAFAGRWIIVLAFGLLPAYVATPLMNLQFVWMVAIGFVAFGEVPEAGTVIGVLLVICSSLWLVRDEMLPGKAATT